MKRLLLVLFVLVLSCATHAQDEAPDTPSPPPPQAPKAPKPGMSINQEALNAFLSSSLTGNFSLFALRLFRFAIRNGIQSSITAFVPANLPTLAIQNVPAPDMARLLSYHIILGRYTGEQLRKMRPFTQFRTLQGSNLTLMKVPYFNTVMLKGKNLVPAVMIRADLQVRQHVIVHGISQLLQPIGG